MKYSSILTVEEVANHLKVSTKTIYRLIERKELPAIRVSRMYRIDGEDFKLWLDEQKGFRLRGG
ncbi:MAG: helix-turn-helix domain-containing protein [Actinobacteria bacterium]|nr:helix-turn-helix domain-containing protein [Actinomycetota bacterium]